MDPVMSPSASTPTSTGTLDATLDGLAEGERRWAGLPLIARGQLLRDVAAATLEHAQFWVESACRAKSLERSSPLVGEEWLSGPYAVATNAAMLADSIDALARGVSPLSDVRSSPAPGGRTALHVFPRTTWDRVLMSGFSADVWLSRGLTAADAASASGLGQLKPRETRGISVVLGAGNITSIAVLDTLYEVVASNRAVILKLNPVMDEMYDATRAALAPLIDLGLVQVVTGGIDVGAHLIEHPDTAHVHITGSSVSHDAIVFGTGLDGARRKAAGDVRMTKSITSELGGVSPVIVVPGGWSRRDVRFQAEHVATQRLHNGGYNCIAAQVLVVPQDWEHKSVFLATVREEIDSAPARAAYYPGSDDRVQAARRAHPTASECQNGRIVIESLRPGDDVDAFHVEYFSPVLAIVEVPGEPSDYLTAAAAFVNDRLAGTLGANVLVQPRTRRRLGVTFDDFIEALRFGTVAINAWTAVGYLTAAAPWGGYPGASLTRVESGIGVVHNALLIDQTEKTVVTGPFRPLVRSLGTGQSSLMPKPAWFVTNRTAATTARRLVAFVAKPGWSRAVAVFWSAVRG
jgi:aldehyde dehydrogenase (NAD(P)+)